MALTSDRPVRWGILGTGAIAHRFAEDFVHVKDGIVFACGSRSAERAEAFGSRFHIPHRYGSYRAVAEDGRVDAVYIATPASEHKNGAELCLHAGKAVLCEKPLTVNAGEAEELIALARRSGSFLMEGMWTRFLPLIDVVQKLLAQNAIGEVRHLMADLASDVEFDPTGRVFSADLGGGALLQKGVYLLSLASMILGSPTGVKSISVFGKSGIDESTGVLMEYPKGALATLWCSVRARGNRRAIIAGTHGQIVIHDPIICPSTLTLRRYELHDRHHSRHATTEPGLKGRLIRYAKSSLVVRNLRERFPMLADRLLYGIRSSRVCVPPMGEGLHYQVGEVNRCLRAGQLESHVMPLHESLNIQRTMDRIRDDSHKMATNAI